MMLKLRAITVGLFVFVARLRVATDNDLIWPLCYARHLPDPYAACRVPGFAANMLPTALLVYPFAGLSDSVAAALIFGLSCALLTYGLRDRWPVLFSLPMVIAFQFAQWSPLILACALLPGFMPLVLVKPHIGIAAFVRNYTHRRALVIAAIVLVSLLIFPAWPLVWMREARAYDGYIPLLTLPGLALLLLLPNPRARYVLLCAISPQRGIYDALIVAGALPDRRAALAWALITWLFLPLAMTPISGPWAITLICYLPLLLPQLHHRIDFFRRGESAIHPDA